MTKKTVKHEYARPIFQVNQFGTRNVVEASITKAKEAAERRVTWDSQELSDRQWDNKVSNSVHDADDDTEFVSIL